MQIQKAWITQAYVRVNKASISKSLQLIVLEWHNDEKVYQQKNKK